MKERTWLGILLSFAAPCRGKMAASVVLAILSVAGGFVPYLGVYQIIRLFLERQADWDGILFWCGVCLAGYAVKVAGYALSTMLAHPGGSAPPGSGPAYGGASWRGGVQAYRRHEEHHRGPDRGH